MEDRRRDIERPISPIAGALCCSSALPNQVHILLATVLQQPLGHNLAAAAAAVAAVAAAAAAACIAQCQR